MGLMVYNVLSRKKEEFIPMEPGKVKMYACGITASGNAHIGHALQAVVFDMIKKYLEFKGYIVTYVRNYTDVDDKIIDKANKLGINPIDYAEGIMKKTNRELDMLGVTRPTIESRATECIDDIIALIKVLEEKGHAYKAENGDVFFDVSSFPRYGNFSNRILDESIHGVRIETDPNKRDEKDFALWKAAKENEISWDSPWGKGRPGWHIECSAMSMKFLGETLDIHGGGKDLIFPHHENEIAQSEAATGKQFSRYWLHNGLIKVNGQKMGKSLGNSLCLDEILEKYNKDVIRLVLLHTHYRSDLNITEGMFEQFEKRVYELYKNFYIVDLYSENLVLDKKTDISKELEDKFVKAMDNDFNTAVVIADFIQYLSKLKKYILEKEWEKALELKNAMINTYAILGICQMEPEQTIKEIRNKHLEKSGLTEEEINNLLQKRALYKKEKNFSAADEIRKYLTEHSIEVKDNRNGVEWDLIISE